jgi:hypothetical protein
VRITSLSGAGLLSFEQFGLGLRERVTFVVGPNGAAGSYPALFVVLAATATAGAVLAAAAPSPDGQSARDAASGSGCQVRREQADPAG